MKGFEYADSYFSVGLGQKGKLPTAELCKRVLGVGLAQLIRPVQIGKRSVGKVTKIHRVLLLS